MHYWLLRWVHPHSIFQSCAHFCKVLMNCDKLINLNPFYFCLILLVFSFSLDLGAWLLREVTPPAPNTYSLNLTADRGVSPASSDQWKVNSLHFLVHSAVLIFPQLWLPLLPWRPMSFSPRDDADCQRLDKLTGAWWGTSWFFLLSLSFRRSLRQAHTKGKLIRGCIVIILEAAFSSLFWLSSTWQSAFKDILGSKTEWNTRKSMKGCIHRSELVDKIFTPFHFKSLTHLSVFHNRGGLLRSTLFGFYVTCGWVLTFSLDPSYPVDD